MIAAVKARHPDFVFVAEAYWDLEWALQQQGFDYCYDKRLYDRLVHEGAESVRGHLTADIGYQQRARPLHREPRRAARGRDRSRPAKARAAAVATLTQTGARLVHEGQLEGRRGAACPSSSPAGPTSRPTPSCGRSTSGCSAALARPASSAAASGSSASAAAGTGNDTWQNLVAWGWRGDVPRKLVVVNLGDAPAAGPRLAAVGRPARARAGGSTTRRPASVYERSGDDLRDGLYVALDPWAWHLFDLTPLDPGGLMPPMPKPARPPSTRASPRRPAAPRTTSSPRTRGTSGART